MLVARAWPLLLLCACFVDPGVSSGSNGSNDTSSTTPDPTSTTGGPTSSSSTTAVTDGTGTGESTSPGPTTGPATTEAVDSTDTSTTVDTTTTTDATDTDASTTGLANPCGGDILVESLEITKADLGGGTTYDNTSFGELVAFGSPGDYVEWTFSLTCGAPWRMFLRYPEVGFGASYELAIDDIPPFVTDAGCTGPSIGMRWQIFNARKTDADYCELLIDPYLPLLDAGEHTLRITFRDNTYVGSVVYSNAPDYEP